MIEHYSSESVGKWLRGHRARLGGGTYPKNPDKPLWTHKRMTQWLAERGVVIGESAYRAYDNGNTRPSYETIAKLHSVLGDWPEAQKPEDEKPDEAATSSDGLAAAIRAQTEGLLEVIRRKDEQIDRLMTANAALMRDVQSLRDEVRASVRHPLTREEETAALAERAEVVALAVNRTLEALGLSRTVSTSPAPRG